jgi:hypothetical protein
MELCAGMHKFQHSYMGDILIAFFEQGSGKRAWIAIIG